MSDKTIVDMYGKPEEDLEGPIEYLVEFWNGLADPCGSYHTFGGWKVESGFLMVYTQEGIKSGHIVDEDVHMITTKVVTKKVIPDADELTVVDGAPVRSASPTEEATDDEESNQ
jgi:hypothetical protein